MMQSHQNIQTGYIVEAVNVDKPVERAYLYMEDLANMRGEILEEYIDE